MFSCSSIPRPEYPRPDRQRGSVEGYDWLNLNGPWQFRFDPDRRGLEEHWFSPELPEWRGQTIGPICCAPPAPWGQGGAAGEPKLFCRAACSERRALLVLRVEDPMDNSEQPVGKQWRWYTTSSGIWQTVYIEPRHETHIKSFRIVTDIDAATAHFSIACDNAGADCEVGIEIPMPENNSDGEWESTQQFLHVRNGVAEQTIEVP